MTETRPIQYLTYLYIIGRCPNIKGLHDAKTQ